MRIILARAASTISLGEGMHFQLSAILVFVAFSFQSLAMQTSAVDGTWSLQERLCIHTSPLEPTEEPDEMFKAGRDSLTLSISEAGKAAEVETVNTEGHVRSRRTSITEREIFDVIAFEFMRYEIIFGDLLLFSPVYTEAGSCQPGRILVTAFKRI